MPDFRSDTVTQPTPGMLDAMREASVGDDVLGDDPSVNALEGELANMAGKEAALFVPSGTQSNLIAIMSHCERGDEYIAGQDAHCYRWEAGGAAVLGSVQPQPIANAPDGSLSLDLIEAAIKPDDTHFARTKLLALENTIGGKALSMAYMSAASELARNEGLGIHLDGARVFNACTVLGVPLRDVAELFDTVSICLSKGLGAPVGSVLVGTANLISKGRGLRKMLGGGMRQAGYLAAAGRYAIANNVARLADDHLRAQRLAAGFGGIAELTVEQPQSNMFFVDIAPERASAFSECLTQADISVSSRYGGRTQRWVTHLDIDDDDVERAITHVRAFFGAASPGDRQTSDRLTA